MKSYGPDTDLGYVLNCDLGDMTFGHGHNCVKYYPDPTWQ